MDTHIVEKYASKFFVFFFKVVGIFLYFLTFGGRIWYDHSVTSISLINFEKKNYKTKKTRAMILLRTLLPHWVKRAFCRTEWKHKLQPRFEVGPLVLLYLYGSVSFYLTFFSLKLLGFFFISWHLGAEYDMTILSHQFRW